MTDPKPLRLQIVLPERSMQRLEQLRTATEAEDYAEVIRNALRLYEAAVAHTESGGIVLFQSPSGARTAAFSEPSQLHAARCAEADANGLMTGRRL